MAFFGLKSYFKKIFLGYFCLPIKVMSKNWVKMASKLVFIGAGRICPPCHSGCIPDAASCRVKISKEGDSLPRSWCIRPWQKNESPFFDSLNERFYVSVYIHKIFFKNLNRHMCINLFKVG